MAGYRMCKKIYLTHGFPGRKSKRHGAATWTGPLCLDHSTVEKQRDK